jgi:transcriptional regulator with XRE-family HTH domain
MPYRSFFTGEMGTRLRGFRLRAGLTLDEVGERMGLAGKGRSGFIFRLETGRVHDPAAGTLVRYLQVCGAYMDEFFGQFNRVDFVGVRPLPKGASKREREIQQLTRNETLKWQLQVARPSAGKPLSPKQQQAGARRFRDYRQMVNSVEAAVEDELMRREIHPIYHIRYKAYARSVLKELRGLEPQANASERNRRGKGLETPVHASKRHRNNGQDAGPIANLGLDARVAARVRTVVARELKRLAKQGGI